MTEEVNLAQNQEAGLDAFSDSPSDQTTEQVDSQQSEQTPTVNEEKTQPSEPASKPSPEGSQDVAEPETKKETRAERRIKSLVEKLKVQNPQDVKDVISNKKEPLISPEELETGVDPKVIEQRADQRAESRSEEIKNQVKSELAYEQAYNQHMSDIAKVSEELKDNPELDELVAEQYELTNRILNPFTGEYVWAPVATMSEVKTKVEKALNKLMVRSSAAEQASVQQTINTSAVPASGSPKSAPKKDEFLDGFNDY